MRRIGELLVAEGLLSEAAVNRALGFQRLSGERVKLGSILLNWDLLAEEALLATLAKCHHVAAVDWQTLSSANIEVVRLLPSANAIRLGAVPCRFERGQLLVAFLNPSNLAAVDEVSALTGKRVVPGVTTEVRLIQAHQKFYGRHIPGEYRIIVQKLERKTSQVTRPRESRAAVDFRAPDLVSAADGTFPISDGFPASTPIRIGSLSDLPGSTTPTPPPPIHPREPLPPPPSPIATSPPSGTGRDGPAAGDDSLTRWVGDALTSFQQDRGVGRRPPPPHGLGASATPPGFSSAQPAPRGDSVPADEQIAGMWRPAPIDDPDDVVAGMWTSGEEPGPQLWEARSREEIGDAVLQNALTNLPRVILFGAGRSGVTGWRGRGPDLTAEQIAAVRIPATERSVFASVESTGVPHFGPVERAEWPNHLAELLGPTPLDCAIFPIRILDGVAAFLYADRLGQSMQYQDFALVARAAASTANILARFLLRPAGAPAT